MAAVHYLARSVTGGTSLLGMRAVIRRSLMVCRIKKATPAPAPKRVLTPEQADILAAELFGSAVVRLQATGCLQIETAEIMANVASDLSSHAARLVSRSFK